MKLPAHQKMLSAAAAASVMLLTAACGASDGDGASTPDTSTSSAASGAATDGSSGSTVSGPFADGTYSAEGSYSNPGGQSTVKVDLTVADGKVSEVSVTPEASNGTSKQYQTQFADGVSGEVVGKSLDEVKVSKVAGSSLTSQGFNAALEEIKTEAQA